MHFGAGVRTDIDKVILAQATPPATIKDMLAAAEAVEAEQAKKGGGQSCQNQHRMNMSFDMSSSASSETATKHG